VRFNVAVPVPDRFVAVKITANDPALVGVPEMTPEAASTERPGGRPAAAKAAAVLAVIVYEKGVFTTAPTSRALVICGVPPPPPPLVFTVSVKVAVPVPDAFVALSDTVVVPAVVGVPLIAPVEALTDNPAGSPLAPKLAGELVAVIE
jgi:hypothetical protein